MLQSVFLSVHLDLLCKCRTFKSRSRVRGSGPACVSSEEDSKVALVYDLNWNMFSLVLECFWFWQFFCVIFLQEHRIFRQSQICDIVSHVFSLIFLQLWYLFINEVKKPLHTQSTAFSVRFFIFKASGVVASGEAANFSLRTNASTPCASSLEPNNTDPHFLFINFH